MSDPLGILHFNLARGWRGGEQQTWMLMKELADQGYHQGLCAHPEGPLAQKVANEPWGVQVFSPAKILFNPQSASAFHIGHAHDGRGAYLAWRWGRGTKNPYVITRRMQDPPKKKFLTHRVYGSASALVGISSASCQGLKQFVNGHYVHHIPSAFSPVPDGFTAGEGLTTLPATHENTTVIGHAGALVDAHKGQKDLVVAVACLRQRGIPATLVLMGDGPDRPELERYAAHNSWLHVAGHVNPISSYVKAIDIFAFPSRHEGLGSVLLDVMLAGVPIVASDVGGIPDIVRHGETGLLTPPNNPKALETALAELINNPSRASSFAKAAHLAVAGFSPSAMSASYKAIYSDLSS